MSDRADRLAERLAERELDALVVTDLLNIRYLTGFTGTNAVCVVGPERRDFITDFRYVERAEQEVEGMQLTARDAQQRVRRAQHGEQRDELLAQLEELAAWYRDLVVVAAGADSAVVHFDRLAELREDGSRERMLGAERACETVRQTWRNLEEFQLNAGLAVTGLLVTLRRELAA